jgi:hypothetical protein
MKKICSTCKKKKPLDQFHKNKNCPDGHFYICKDCKNARNKEFYHRSYYKVMRERSVRLKEKLNAYSIKWNHENRERVRQKRLLWDKKNASKRRRYTRELYHNSPQYKMKVILRSRLTKVLKSRGVKKTLRTMELLGCSANDFRKYIESRLLTGMTWDNYGRGKGKWVVDHIIPCASFDLTKEEEQKKCFHYTNMTPLWDGDNLHKSSWHNGIYYRKQK